LINRGEVFTNYAKIQDDLHWMIGYKRVTYKKHHVEKAMKYLRKATMVATRKTTRGLHITVCNYEYYNNIKNYESDNESYTIATMKLQGVDTIHKNDKELENEKLNTVKEEKKIEKKFAKWEPKTWD
jgi:hypothetical protein